MNFAKNYKFWSSSTNFGWFGSNLGQNRPKKFQNVPIGLERKIRPLFHMVSVTGYKFSTKIANFCSQGSILVQNWVKIGPALFFDLLATFLAFIDQFSTNFDAKCAPIDP